MRLFSGSGSGSLRYLPVLVLPGLSLVTITEVHVPQVHVPTIPTSLSTFPAHLLLSMSSLEDTLEQASLSPE